MKETNTTAWFQSLEKALGKLAAIAAVAAVISVTVIRRKNK